MIELLNAAWALVLTVVSSLSAHWQDALICLAASLGATQVLKPYLRQRGVVQLTAFAIAAGPMAWLHPDKPGLLIAFTIGALSPAVYKTAMFFIWRRWPTLGQALSSDHDYTLSDFAQRREPPP